MRASAVAWVVGCGVGLLTAAANAQAPAAAFPPEPKPNAPAPANVAPPPTEPPQAAAPAAVAPPASPAPVPVERTPAAVAPPTLALAQEPKSPRDWNVGAGVFSVGDSIGLSFGQSFGAPSYNAALERRLGERSWLALNLRFSYESRELPRSATSDDPPGTVSINTTRVGALLGIRYVFVQGLVDVSGFSGVFASSQNVSDGQLQASGLIGQTGIGDGNALGLLLGMAVERELIEALALRLSLDLATASISSDDSSRLDSAGVEQHTSLGTERVVVGIQPALQLHFYF